MTRIHQRNAGGIAARGGRLLLLAVIGLSAAPARGFAQSVPSPPSLRQMSLEDLMNIEITSASRKEQRAGDVAAAIFVITSDDIRRSGMTTVPDLLRLAPGVDVAQINASRWAVSVRGFNGVYANKLLVLIDGRSIYNRLFAGVVWDAEDLMIDDIERIEIIRGPGAAMWGANAMNGVINIVTKAATEAQGWLVRADGGVTGTQGAARYGGALGTMRYRLYALWNDRDDSLLASGDRAGDSSRGVTTGFRTDWTTAPDAVTLEGAFKVGQFHALWANLDPQTAAGEPISTGESDEQNGHLLARWTRTRDNGAALQVQSFIDLASRREPIGSYDRRSFDVDSQYHVAVGGHQDLVAGAGYRFIDESYGAGVGLSLDPARDRSSLLTVFLQDEIALAGDRLMVTLGSQAQYDSVAGAGLQPTARVLWKVRPGQRLWAAASRALRTPSSTDRTVHVTYPPVPTASGLPLVVTVDGNREQETETLIDLELGYRLEVGTMASVDVTAFGGRYDNLLTQEIAAPVVQFVPSPQILVSGQFGNQLDASTRGLEVAGHWSPLPSWRLDGSYTAFHLTPRVAAGSQDPTASSEDGAAPQAQWQLRSTLSPVDRLTLGAALFHVGRLKQLGVPAYTRADVSAEWRLARGLSVMAIGQNLLDQAHREFTGDESLLTATEVRRGASLRLRWTFR